MDPRLTTALAPVLRDLAGAELPALRFTDEPWSGVPGHLTAGVRGTSGGRSGVGIMVDDGPAASVVRIADEIQEVVVEELWNSGLPTNWPPCPRHPDRHPLMAVLVDGTPWWSCAADGLSVARIGQLFPG